MSRLNKHGTWRPAGRDQLCKVVNADFKTVWSDALLAKGFITRGKGLLGYRSSDFSIHTAIIFPKCSGVHCAFMRMSIDIVSLSSIGEVLATQTVQPWGSVNRFKGTKTIIEAQAGSAARNGIAIGDILTINQGVQHGK